MLKPLIKLSILISGMISVLSHATSASSYYISGAGYTIISPIQAVITSTIKEISQPKPSMLSNFTLTSTGTPVTTGEVEIADSAQLGSIWINPKDITNLKVNFSYTQPNTQQGNIQFVYSQPQTSSKKSKIPPKYNVTFSGTVDEPNIAMSGKGTTTSGADPISALLSAVSRVGQHVNYMIQGANLTNNNNAIKYTGATSSGIAP